MLKQPVVVYVRVSSDGQREAHTIEGQIEALRNYCEREGITPADTYRDDGESGDLPFLARPDGKRLLTDAKSGKFATVLVYLYDRFSRNVYEGLAAAKLLKDAGASPYSLMEPFDINTPHGQYMFVNSLNNAELWKAQFKERCIAGLRRSARQGVWVGSMAPYGYKTTGKKSTRRLIVDDDLISDELGMSQADVVRWAFQMAENGETVYQITKALNARNIPSRFSQDEKFLTSVYQYRGKWGNSSVYNLLTNKAYTGACQYGKRSKRPEALANLDNYIIELECPAIVSKEQWERVQRQLTENKRMSKRPTDRKYLLGGLIRCENCGRSYTGATYNKELADATGNEKGAMYHCNSQSRPSSLMGMEVTKCPSSTVPGSFEKVMWDHIAEMLRNPGDAAAKVAERLSAGKDDSAALTEEMERVKAAIDAKDGERAVILGLLRRLKIDTDTGESQLDEIKKEEDILKDQAGKIQERLTESGNMIANAYSVQAILSELAKKVDAGDDLESGYTWERKREIVVKLIKEIRVTTVSTPERIDRRGAGKRIGSSVITVVFRYGNLTDVKKL